jgi:hypothetical protein
MARLTSRVLIVIELILVLVAMFGIAIGLMYLPIFSAAEDTSIPLLAKLDLLIACIGIVPIVYLALGYLRSGKGEFTAAFDAPWCIAGGCSIGLAAICAYAIARFSIVGGIPIVTAFLIVPFAHAMVAGVVARRLTIGSSDRGVVSPVN